MRGLAHAMQQLIHDTDRNDGFVILVFDSKSPDRVNIASNSGTVEICEAMDAARKILDKDPEFEIDINGTIH